MLFQNVCCSVACMYTCEWCVVHLYFINISTELRSECVDCEWMYVWMYVDRRRLGDRRRSAASRSPTRTALCSRATRSASSTSSTSRATAGTGPLPNAGRPHCCPRGERTSSVFSVSTSLRSTERSSLPRSTALFACGLSRDTLSALADSRPPGTSTVLQAFSTRWSRTTCWSTRPVCPPRAQRPHRPQRAQTHRTQRVDGRGCCTCCARRCQLLLLLLRNLQTKPAETKNPSSPFWSLRSSSSRSMTKRSRNRYGRRATVLDAVLLFTWSDLIRMEM